MNARIISEHIEPSRNPYYFECVSQIDISSLKKISSPRPFGTIRIIFQKIKHFSCLSFFPAVQCRIPAYKHDFFVLESKEYTKFTNRRTTFTSLLMETAVLQNMSNTDKKICQRHPLVYPQQGIKHRRSVRVWEKSAMSS